jgi:hypothetical protein
METMSNLRMLVASFHYIHFATTTLNRTDVHWVVDKDCRSFIVVATRLMVLCRIYNKGDIVGARDLGSVRMALHSGALKPLPDRIDEVLNVRWPEESVDGHGRCGAELLNANHVALEPLESRVRPFEDAFSAKSVCFAGLDSINLIASSKTEGFTLC